MCVRVLFCSEEKYSLQAYKVVKLMVDQFICVVQLLLSNKLNQMDSSKGGFSLRCEKNIYPLLKMNANIFPHIPLRFFTVQLRQS